MEISEDFELVYVRWFGKKVVNMIFNSNVLVVKCEEN